MKARLQLIDFFVPITSDATPLTRKSAVNSLKKFGPHDLSTRNSERWNFPILAQLERPAASPVELLLASVIVDLHVNLRTPLARAILNTTSSKEIAFTLDPWAMIF
jgi:hypothetical protein